MPGSCKEPCFFLLVFKEAVLALKNYTHSWGIFRSKGQLRLLKMRWTFSSGLQVRSNPVCPMRGYGVRYCLQFQSLGCLQYRDRFSRALPKLNSCFFQFPTKTFKNLKLSGILSTFPAAGHVVTAYIYSMAKKMRKA